MNVPIDFPFVEVVVRECVVDRRHYSPVFCKGENMKTPACTFSVSNMYPADMPKHFVL